MKALRDKHLVGEDADVFTERVRRTDICTGQTDLTRSTRCQLTFLKDESQQREQRMTVHKHQPHALIGL